MSLNRSSRARIRRMALAGAVSASLAVSLTPATAFAEVVQDKNCVADNKIVAAHSGTFEWSVRDSLVRYITIGAARGSVESTGSVTDAGSGKNWTFTAGQAYSADPDSVTLFVPGTLHFIGHGEGENAKLNITFSDFRLEITGTQAVMYLDAKFRKFEGITTIGEWETMNNVRFAEWTLSEPFTGQWGETVTFTSDGEGYMTEEGKVAFGGFYYSEKEPVSPLKVGSVTFGEDCNKPDSEPVPGDGDADGGDADNGDSETPGDTDSGDAGEGDTDNGNTDGGDADADNGNTDGGDADGDADGSDSETPGDADGSDAGEGDTDNGDADGGDSETPGDADGGDAGEGDTDNGDADGGDSETPGDADSGDAGEGDADGGDADNGDSETPGDTDSGDAGEGDTDNGNTDGGDADGGDAGEGDTDNGDADGGDADGGDADEGDTDNGDADGGDSETPGDADGGDAGEGGAGGGGVAGGAGGGGGGGAGGG
ncbi:HtaA domain-containing protein, partial [Corynebacterium sp. TAE3-ERU30]|uniref:HtaA domain-containing protein n=1 Tax=Corynebacterium sp. TAE3-ERU30 TaxID=2849496 RepID=UPI001C47134D